MSCDRSNPCRPDPIEQEARALSQALDNRNPNVANYLREDSYNMPPGAFNRLVNRIQELDKQGTGHDIYVDRGDLVIDTRNRNGDQIVVATRDYDMRHNNHRYANRQADPRWEQGYDPRYERQDNRYPQQGRRPEGAAEALPDVLMGAAVMGIAKGGKGAADGAMGVIGAKTAKQMSGVQEGTIGEAGVELLGGAAGGAILHGKEGAKNGLTAAGINILLEKMRGR